MSVKVNYKNIANLLKEHFYSFSTDESFTLPIINDNSTSLFTSVLNGETFVFGELNDVSFISKSMSDYLETHQDVNVLFTNKVKANQATILNNIIERNNESINNSSFFAELCPYLNVPIICSLPPVVVPKNSVTYSFPSIICY